VWGGECIFKTELYELGDCLRHTVTEHYWSSSVLPPHSSIYSKKKKRPGVPTQLRQLAGVKGKE
jgi:hypothetical protein